MQGVVIMATQTSLIAQQTRIREWAERSVTVRADQREWMLKHGVPRIILQKRTTIIGFEEFGKYIWNNSGKLHLSLSKYRIQSLK